MSEAVVLSVGGSVLVLNEFWVAERRMPTGKVYRRRFYTTGELDLFVGLLGDDLRNWGFKKET